MEAGSCAREAGGNSVLVVSKRAFLQQFLPEVELAAPFSLAAARSHALSLGGLGSVLVSPGR